MPQHLSLKIGPLGVRGVVGESLTPQLVTSFAAAFGTYCGAGPILVGTDTRPSREMVKQATIAGLLSVGCTPVDVGIVPVPVLMFHVRESGAFGGISVSGGHGSLEWNALKFIGSEGVPLRANQAAELTDLYHQGFFPRVRALDMSEVRTDSSSVGRHVHAVVQAVDVARVRARKLRVAVDPRGGSACAATRQLLEALGCDVVAINVDGDLPRPVSPEPDDADLADLRELVIRSGAEIGFAQNEDADRLAIVDQHGNPLGGDMPLVLVLQRWLERQPGPVVVNVATSRMVDDVAARFGCVVFRSRVGEVSVLEAMVEHGAEAGGEGDGGVIVRPINPCRDSLTAMAVILEAMAVSACSIADLRGRVPRYALIRDRLLCPPRDVAPSLRLIKHLFSGERLDLSDGVRVDWPDRWLLARPATSEPVIRLTAEAPTEEDARSLVTRVLEALSPGA